MSVVKTSREDINEKENGLPLINQPLVYSDLMILMIKTVMKKWDSEQRGEKSCNCEWIKGQLNSEWIYEVIVSPKMPTKIFKDFCPGSLLLQG